MDLYLNTMVGHFLHFPTTLNRLIFVCSSELEFDDATCAMKQSPIENCHVWMNFACSTELWNFLWYAVIRCEWRRNCTLRISDFGQKFYEMMHTTMLQMTITWPCLANFWILWCWSAEGAVVLWMGLLPDTQNCGLRMRRECRERFPRHRLQRKPLVSDPGMHHGTCVTDVSWCMSGSPTRSGGENVPAIPGATRNFMYLVRGPCLSDPVRWLTSWH